MDPDGKHQQILAAACATPWISRRCRASTAALSSPPTWERTTSATTTPRIPSSSSTATRAPSRPARTTAGPPATSTTAQPHADPLISAPKPTDHIVPAPPAGPPPPQFDCTKIPARLHHVRWRTVLRWAGVLRLRQHRACRDVSRRAPRPQPSAHRHRLPGRPLQSGQPPSAKLHHRLPRDREGAQSRAAPAAFCASGPDSFLLTDDLDGVVYYVHAA